MLFLTENFNSDTPWRDINLENNFFPHKNTFLNQLQSKNRKNYFAAHVKKKNPIIP